MKKKNMLEYLDEQLEKKLKDYDFAIDWDRKTHRVTIIVVLYAHNNQSLKVEDLEGVQSEEEVIEFEDALLLYPQGDQGVEEDREDYLTMLPYEGKKGMTQGEIEGIAGYLFQVLELGEEELMDFLQDETKESFELHWDPKKFQSLVDTHMKRKNGQMYYSYPRY
ncbi:DUF3013 family protein [Vagococcus elongatus]|uniref:DUF3013 domain-containing protein n=1 Tax=Vagococcus elongatus TaxID=180344 RepID=A0A430ALY3_9ENTE|nr:DUF3013 family protein [Vagococcus elongatus]RSU09131.1 hypothetical protein CBF29_12205 [Vagococcus elongatus]